jgi:hypothetical protein
VNDTKYAKEFEFQSDEYQQGEIVQIKADGNCGFRCLSYALTGTEDNHVKMREDILEYLEKSMENYQNGIQADDWCGELPIDNQKKFRLERCIVELMAVWLLDQFI